MRPHYPVTHRQAQKQAVVFCLVTLGAIVGVALALGAIALAHCRP